MAKISNKKKKERQKFALDRGTITKTICFNCGESIFNGYGHFVMPCFGDGGFYTCDQKPLDNPAKAAKIA